MCKECFELKGGTLYIKIEPFSAMDNLAILFESLLQSEGKTLRVVFSDSVYSIASQYAGMLVMTGVMANQQGKTLKVYCMPPMANILRMMAYDQLDVCEYQPDTEEAEKIMRGEFDGEADC